MGTPRAEIISKFAPAAHYVDGNPVRRATVSPTLETSSSISGGER